MFEPLAPGTSNQLTLFAEAFPVSPTPWLAGAAALRTTATSGPSSPESFASLDRDGCWRKTSQGYCQMMLDGSLEAYSETWPRAGMTRSGTAYLLAPSAPLTDATASGWLPTPNAESYGTNQGGAAGRVGPVRPSLETMARRGLWPTPTAVTETGGIAMCKCGGSGARAKLRTLVTPDELNGALNPAWVEWLMGYPTGWTDCADSGTRSCRRSRTGSVRG
jgi:hypothetical protein